MIRIATVDDLPIILDMALKFASASPHKDKVDPEVMENRMCEALTNPNSVVLLSEDNGMILGIILPFYYGLVKGLTELGWWVEPEARNQGIGQDLILTFEHWAAINDCKYVTMTTLDDKVGGFLEKHGYSLTERAYVKELT